MENEEEKQPKFYLSLIKKPQIINKDIYLFTYILLKKIFIGINEQNSKKLEEKLNNWLEKINKSIIKNNEYFINKEYSINNLKNIILFIKIQNTKYNGDIIENILIYIFSQIFQTKQENTFSKYIYNNLTKIRENLDIIKWIQIEKIKPQELKNLEELFEIDGKENENKNSEKQKESVFYNFLREILKQKYPYNIFHNNYNIKNSKYIYSPDFFNFYTCNIIYNKLQKNSDNILDKDMTTNSIMNIVSNLSFPISRVSPINQLILSFFIQVFIFYQNKNSPLLNYTLPSKELATIPFVYDLRGACIEGRFSYIILSPLKVQDFISKIFLKQNNLRESGLFELGKILVFNDNITNIECDTCLIKSQYLDFFNYAMGLFDNNSVEEINLSYNYLKEISDEFLIKILKHFKGLKTLNISNNEMKRGLRNIFVVLKKLYRNKKTKLENLIINKCHLDDSSLYELGNLIKCKYCKLKKLVLNNNSFQYNNNFIKNMKRNKNLEEIYLNKNEINNSYVDNILRVISITNIKYLYLFKNKLTKFKDFLRILYRTKIIKDKKINNIIIPNETCSLINLDLSNNDFPIKNPPQIKLLDKIIKETSLYCLDICHILYGPNPDKWKETQDNINYKNSVEEIKNYLEKIKSEYSEVIKNIRINEVEMNNNKSLEKEELIQKYIKQDEVDKILGDSQSKYSGYLIKEVKNMIEKNDEIKNIINYDDDLYDDTVDKFKNYLVLKRSEKKLVKLKEQKFKKKLIII